MAGKKDIRPKGAGRRGPTRGNQRRQGRAASIEARRYNPKLRGLKPVRPIPLAPTLIEPGDVTQFPQIVGDEGFTGKLRPRESLEARIDPLGIKYNEAGETYPVDEAGRVIPHEGALEPYGAATDTLDMESQLSESMAVRPQRMPLRQSLDRKKLQDLPESERRVSGAGVAHQRMKAEQLETRLQGKAEKLDLDHPSAPAARSGGAKRPRRPGTQPRTEARARNKTPLGRRGGASVSRSGGRIRIVAGEREQPKGVKRVAVTPRTSAATPSRDTGFGDTEDRKDRKSQAQPPGKRPSKRTGPKASTVKKKKSPTGQVSMVEDFDEEGKEKPWIRVKTTLKKEKFFVWEFEGTEGLSQIGEFRLLISSHKAVVNIDDLLGKPLIISVDFGKKKRYFHGICGKVSQVTGKPNGIGEQYFYEIMFYPVLWFMQFSKQYRIYQNKTPINIIKDIFKKLKIKNVKYKCKKKGKVKREYCVQYGESDYDFIQRLMEEEGIFYHVEHSKKGHRIYLGDDKSYYKAVRENPKVRVKERESAGREERCLHSVHLQKVTVPSRHYLADYNPTSAKTKLATLSKGEGAGGQIYEYPAGVDAEDALKKSKMTKTGDLWLDGMEALQDTIAGESNVPFFEPSKHFLMLGHDRKKANQKYALYQVKHKAIWNPDDGAGEKMYTNSYVAFDADKAFVPERKTEKNRILGAQTAKVTGPLKEEIYTDKYGRIKVKFHWDQSINFFGQTTCWVRVAQGWAGSGWGVLFLPRVGQEVIITFLDGDPNRPLVTGAVYNSSNMPPYLPKEKTKSTIKSQSYKDTRKKKGFNELRFEDKAKEEEIYLHAQHDWNTDVEFDRTTTIIGGDEKKTINVGSRTVELKADDKAKNDTKHKGKKGDDTLRLHKGSRLIELLSDKGKKKVKHTLIIKKGDKIQTIDIGDEINTWKKGSQKNLIKLGNQETKITKGNQTTKITKGNQSTDVTKGNISTKITKGNYDLKLMKGDRTTQIVGKDTEKVMQGYAGTIMKEYKLKVVGNMEITVAGDLKIKAAKNIQMQAGMNFDVKAGMNVKTQAGMKVEGKAGIGVSFQGGATAEMKGGASAKVQGGASGELQGGGMAKVQGGGMMQAQGGGMGMIQAAIVKVN